MFDYLNGVQLTEIKIPSVENSELMNVLHFETWSMSIQNLYDLFMTVSGLFVISGLALTFLFKKSSNKVLHHTCTPNLVNLPNATLCCVWCAGIKESDTGLAPPALWDLAADKQTLQSE